MKRLSDLREEKKLSQRGLADLLKVSQGTLCNWEKGRTEPSIQQMIEIAKFFEVSVDYLIGNSDEIGTISIEKQISKEDLQILQIINSLSDSSKERLLDFIKSLDNNNN